MEFAFSKSEAAEILLLLFNRLKVIILLMAQKCGAVSRVTFCLLEYPVKSTPAAWVFPRLAQHSTFKLINVNTGWESVI